MTGKKSVNNKSTSTKQANKHEAVTAIVKSILVDTDITKIFRKVFLESIFSLPDDYEKFEV